MKEKIISIIIILISILAPLLILPSSIGNSYIPKLIALLILGFILLVVVLINYKKMYINKKDLLLLIFGSLVFISTILSSNVKKSIIGEDNRYEGMIMFFIYILIFFATSKFFKKEYVKKYINIMYVVILIISLISISQYYIVNIDLKPIFRISKSSGSSGTFGNSNFLGSFVSLFLPMLIALYIITGKKKYLFLSYLLFISMLVCIARSSWVAFIIYIAITIIFILYKRKKDYFKRFILIIIGFVCAFILIVNTGKGNVIKKTDKSIDEIKQFTTTGITDNMGSSRIAIWKMTIKLIIKHPIIGVRYR